MSLTIHRIDAIPITMAHSAAFGDWGIASGRGMVGGVGYVLVRVHCADGIVGYGECGRYYEGETQESALLHIRRFLAPHLPDHDALNLHECRRTMDIVLKGNLYAKMAVETAIWDAAGKALGVPVSTLLGGRARDKLDVAASVGIRLSAAAAADQACARVAEGYQAIKLKVGDDPRRDIATVAAIRAAVGPDIGIRIDANQGYRREQALRILRRMEEHDLALIEQPIDQTDLAGMAHLTAHVETAIMADESATGPRAVYDLARLGAADAIQVKKGRAGGLRAARLMADIAATAGLAVGVGAMMELGVGSAANLQLAASIADLSYPIEFNGPAALEDDILLNPIQLEDGQVRVPRRPGLGVEVDEDKVEHIRTAEIA